jgi:hypothetical protein
MKYRLKTVQECCMIGRHALEQYIGALGFVWIAREAERIEFDKLGEHERATENHSSLKYEDAIDYAHENDIAMVQRTYCALDEK